MEDSKSTLRQRRRENLFKLLDLLADEKKQIEYGQTVGDRKAIDELQCMWFDDQYHGDNPDFLKEYDKAELMELKRFNKFFGSLPKQIFGDNIKELIAKDEWKQLMILARATRIKMKEP